jgi:hypothetical protein
MIQEMVFLSSYKETIAKRIQPIRLVENWADSKAGKVEKNSCVINFTNLIQMSLIFGSNNLKYSIKTMY